MNEAIVLLGVGLVAGVAGGLFGIGGSIVMIPAMTWLLGPDQHLYQAAAMIVNFFLVLPAVRHHVRAGAIDRGVISRLIPPALGAMIVGVLLSELSYFKGEGEAVLRLLFGAFVLACAGVEAARLARPGGSGSGGESAAALTWPRAVFVAVPTGVIGGMLGVGGGVVAVPMQRRFLGMKLTTAIANSSATIAATSIVGAVVKNWAVLTDGATHARSPFLLAALLIPTAMAGSFFGASLVHRLPRRKLAIGFVMLLMYVAGRMIHGAASVLLT
ncbi:MAG: sulfite exporter TauE/SafE family protein [Phycisphaerae bacterium]|nr:sulfite exporter TauE/SafE family protein [Planctomycetia bacterium]MCK6464737.1 sulfite exporter TauE/SafE family protein [Phycisphaerae bacterium]MCL4718927.1 sulfite exporter TauE/SafE family protein [Phycisphaerae bacterium]NUQ10118.1 sulfite exporter TauE/SafE family protein [Phycisphaerae bacterium]